MQATLISPTERRRLALDTFLPSWQAARRRKRRAEADVEDAKAELKQANNDVADAEDQLSHIAECRSDQCLRCDELALNGPKQSDGVPPDEDGATEDGDEQEADDQVEDLSAWQEVRDPLALPPGQVIEAEAVVVG